MFKTLRRRQNWYRFTDNIFKCIFWNENVRRFHWGLFLRFTLTIFLQIMALHRPGNKPLSEPMMVSLLMHIYITRPQWIKKNVVKYTICIDHPCSFKVQCNKISCFAVMTDYAVLADNMFWKNIYALTVLFLRNVIVILHEMRTV